MKDGRGILDRLLIRKNMNKILFVIIMGLTCCHTNRYETLSSNSTSSTYSHRHHFETSYNTITEDKRFISEVVSLSDSLEIRYLSTGYNAEYEGGGWGFLIALPKDTTISKICNTKRFGRDQRKLRNALVQRIKNELVEKALSEDVEKYFDVFIYYTRQEYLYVNGGAVADDGKEVPDYSCQDDAPIEEYKLENGKWVLTKYIPNRENNTDLDFGLEKAEEILKDRFGKMAKEMECKE